MWVAMSDTSRTVLAQSIVRFSYQNTFSKASFACSVALRDCQLPDFTKRQAPATADRQGQGHVAFALGLQQTQAQTRTRAQLPKFGSQKSRNLTPASSFPPLPSRHPRLSLPSDQRRDADPPTCDKMLAIGRGCIAQVQYTGDEAAGEIKKLLDAVVRTTKTRQYAHTDSIAGRERR